MRTIVWFRGKDLRLADHVPLLEAIRDGEVVPLFVVDPYFFAPKRAREMPNRMQYLVESLTELADRIASLGSRLLFVGGKSVDAVPAVARALRADRVVAHRWSEPFGVERDRRISSALEKDGTRLVLYEGETLAMPGQVLTKAGTPFSVFGPFARAFAEAVEVEAPRSAPRKLPPLPDLPRSVTRMICDTPSLRSIGVRRNEQIVPAGERAARERLNRFMKRAAPTYAHGRDLMGVDGTSRVSQDLKFGTLSARTVWYTAHARLTDHPKSLRSFTNELLWREFAYDVLRSCPDVLERPFRAAWIGFPWRNDAAAFHAWVSGRTGYPIVDAAARQLLAEGFVHNRARMIAASFLTKHLLIDFRRGEAHYMKHLTDGDWANNDLGWQWSTGCGVDAQPWFRVFNPVAQGRRFDPEGAYVRAWLPELALLPARWIHAPWEAPRRVLEDARVDLGVTYPRPIVDASLARGRFLAAAHAHLGSARG